jgi:hypothetical protein
MGRVIAEGGTTMQDFIITGDYRMKEHARQAERVNRQGWMVANAGPELKPRRGGALGRIFPQRRRGD